MKKIIKWLRESNRYKHLLGGFIIGAFAMGDYCAAYASALSAASLEFKDMAHGGKWDWIDFALVIVGAAVARVLIRIVF